MIENVLDKTSKNLIDSSIPPSEIEISELQKLLEACINAQNPLVIYIDECQKIDTREVG